MKFARRHLLALALATTAAACGGSSSSSSGPSSPVVQADQRLRGRWLLVDYRPEQALEPMLQGLLAAQLNRLTVDVDGRMLRAEGVGVSAQRQYQVTSAQDELASVVVRDPSGAVYELSVTFQAEGLFFTSLTAPWRGTGRLQRLH